MITFWNQAKISMQTMKYAIFSVQKTFLRLEWDYRNIHC